MLEADREAEAVDFRRHLLMALSLYSFDGLLVGSGAGIAG